MPTLCINDTFGNMYPCGSETNGFTGIPINNSFKIEKITVVNSSTTVNATSSGSATSTKTLTSYASSASAKNGVKWYALGVVGHEMTGDGYITIQAVYLESTDSSGGANVKVKLANQSATNRSISKFTVNVLFVRAIDESTGGLANLGTN